MNHSDLPLRAGDWVQVRSKEEILWTLDGDASLDGLPFMPEMFAFCGRRFRVSSRAHKTCDTVGKTGGRRMARTVHLEDLRCDGAAHEDCQAACLLFWKRDWLIPVNDAGPSQEPDARTAGAVGCTEADVMAATRMEDGTADPCYVCQATRIPAATSFLPWWDVRQYLEDYQSGNVRLGPMLGGFAYATIYGLMQAGLGLGRPLRWLYDRLQHWRRGVPFPRRSGLIPEGQPTPQITLNLQAGEWVRVKSYPDILATLNTANRNRGLYFDAEMVPYCGGTYRVLARVERIVNEKTGRLMVFKNGGVILGGVVCRSRYSDRRMFCPRRIYSYWREAWLERVSPGDSLQSHPGRD